LRIVAVNRRDYPGAVPLDEEERRLLTLTQSAAPDSAANIKVYMQHRAQELYDFLQIFVKAEHIPVTAGKKGGLVVAGWSFSACWITALLAHVSSFPVGDVELRSYIQYVVTLGKFEMLCLQQPLFGPQSRIL
jgi:hypothetical protein